MVDSEPCLRIFEHMSTVLIRTRVDTTRAKAAQKILSGLGLKPAEAVNMFFAQVVSRRGIPFAVQEAGAAYVEKEYGVTPGELDRAARRIKREAARARKAGEVTVFKGDWRELRA